MLSALFLHILNCSLHHVGRQRVSKTMKQFAMAYSLTGSPTPCKQYSYQSTHLLGQRVQSFLHSCPALPLVLLLPLLLLTPGMAILPVAEAHHKLLRLASITHLPLPFCQAPALAAVEGWLRGGRACLETARIMHCW